jgi:AraC-like DNA-binding protein
MTSAPMETIELMLRTAAAALGMFLAVQLVRLRPIQFATVAGALFCLGVAAYSLASDDRFALLAGSGVEAFVFLAVLAPAFFWWFGIALFRDPFEWRPIHALPLLSLLAAYGMRQASDETLRAAGVLLHEATVMLLMLHVLSLAVVDFRNDLVDARRRFRLAVAVVLPAVGVVIASAEVYALYRPLPAWLGSLQALALAALSFLFAFWLTGSRPELFASWTPARQLRSDLLTSAELIELERLRAVIGSGACLEPDLSLGIVARLIGVPEHRLRRLIGKGLGYRNFSAFVNAHRVEEARRRLADPSRSREQIVSIAFGVGYASLAPFNRAFRELTGTTPSDYRAQALSQAIDPGKA